MQSALYNFPRQKLPWTQKNKEWRKKVVDWADNKFFLNDNSIRKSFVRKRINYNLVNGFLDMEDIQAVLNPDNVDASYIPENIQHYPTINAKMNILRGEEFKRRYDFRAIVTNPNAISEIEENKRKLMIEELKGLVENQELSEEEYNKRLDDMQYYYTYEWQDMREERANMIIKHYSKELDFREKFNHGFLDVMTVGEEIYQCDIVGGEPTLERINPMKLHVFKNGYSNRIEDADIIVSIDYWSPGRVIDTYYDVLTQKDIDYIDNMPEMYNAGAMDNIDERNGFFTTSDINAFDTTGTSIIDNYAIFGQVYGSSATTNYYDNNGNIRVTRVYWKSKRKIKKVKWFNPETAEEEFDFYNEDFKVDKTLGQEETIFWINEAWEGTKIGKDIYVNMRPRVVQYNRLSNPSKCHFGFIGSVYNFNDNKPYSLVDIMKPYAYLYDVLHDRLNKAIAANWGKIIKVDLALIPKGWELDKWLYYAKVNHMAVVDSFKEGNYGSSTGKLAGMLQQNSQVIDAETGNYIQQHINLLEFVKMEMSEASGISKQREGQVSASETVGGVERATMQSSHITEWLFSVHDNVKKRVLECFIETAKVAMKGRSKKFQHILNDGSIKMVDIDGDEFSECDYGIVMDNSTETNNLANNLDQLAHAAMQNQTLSFSSIMRILTSPSLSEIQRIIERDEKSMLERKSQEMQNESKLREMDIQARSQSEAERRQQEDMINLRDNETKIMLKQMELEFDNSTESSKEELMQKIKEFDEKIRLDRERLQHQKEVDNKKLALEDKKIKAQSKAKAKTA